MASKNSELRISGIAYSVVILLLYLFKLNNYVILLHLSVFLFVLAIIFPKCILPLNFILKPFGGFLINLFTKLILFFLFFLVLTPISLIRNLSKARVIELGFEQDKASYFVDKTQVKYDKDFFEKLY